MSKAPTLLVPGKVKKPEKVSESGADYIVDWVRRRMPEYGGHTSAGADRILIVRSETGSGKSTVLPVALFRILRSKATPSAVRFRGPGVICTQPRVLTAMSLASDVSVERSPWNPDMIQGTTLGYQTGPVSNRPAAGLIYATAGVLAAQLRQQEDAEVMGRYRFILVDEAHERSIESDEMLMLLQNFYRRGAGNPRLPFLFLMSATFDPARYTAYFGVGPANVVEVEGRAYPIAVHWPAQGANDYAAAAAATALRIHEENPADPPERADVLIFVPGADGAERVSEALVRANQKYLAGGGLGPLLVLVINREVVASQSGAFLLVFERPDRLPMVGGRRPARRVIVATVVAETGLTIDTLRYVVDCGWSRSREVYQPWRAEGIITRPAPRSRIQQRKGRVGRLFPGDFYPLYTANVHSALEEQQLPDIVATGYDSLHLVAVREQQRQKLRLRALPEFRVEDLALLDPPPVEAFLAANALAVALGFISPRALLPDRWPPANLEALTDAPASSAAPAQGYGLTTLGHVAAQFSRTPMEGVRVLLAGYIWGAAATDLITAIAMFGTSVSDLLTGKERRRKGGLPPGAGALQAALPPFLVARTGGGPLPPTEAEAFYFRARLLLADDFAEAILIFDAFARRLERSQGAPGPVAAWCLEVGLSFDALIQLARLRETLVEEALLAGLNPWRADNQRLAALSADDFTDGLVRLKRCLYDGLRGRLLQFSLDGPGPPSYVSKQGLRVQAPELLTDAMAGRLKMLGVTQTASMAARPRWILTDRIRLAPVPPRAGEKAPPLLYVASTNLVSVLDGYIGLDPEFDGPRVYADEP